MYKMKKNLIFLVLIIFLSLIFTNSMFGDRFGDLKNESSKEGKNIDKGDYINWLGTSSYWFLNGISIDDSLTGVGAHNWTWAANQPWCSGSGTSFAPYIIENVTINAQSATNGIEIKSSTKYFIIRNVTVHNSSSGVNNAGIYLNNVNNGRLINNTLRNNNGNGIYIINSIDNVLLENRGYNNSWYGIILIGGHYTDITQNRLFNNTKGIYLMNSFYNNLSLNRAFNNSEEGINLLNSKHNAINENTVYNNIMHGVYLSSQSTSNIISENNVNNNLWDGINIWDCVNNTLVGNNATNNSGDGIYLMSGSNNNTVKENTLNKNNQGINLYGNVNNTIIGNTINNSTFVGIRLFNCNFTKVLENTVNNCNEHGIFVEDSNNTSITKNNVYKNLRSGIRLSNSNHSLISQNMATFNAEGSGWDGITLQRSYYNNISKNIVRFNYDDGIALQNSSNNMLWKNVINNNGWAGILFYSGTDDNKIIGNRIKNNPLYGAYIFDIQCDNNLFFYNFFNGNGRHAYDDGMDNYWNSSTIGNYWDNYTGIDTNNDGIGDIPYCLHPEWLPGWVINDSLPIYDISAPDVDILSPVTNDLFGSSSPFFNLALTDHYLDSIWYVINGGSNNLIPSASGQIDQGLWNGFGSGTITLTFYANDSLNQIGLASVTIRKDITSPVINIITPNPNDSFGSSAPDFSINIIETNLGTRWYTLNGGANIFITSSSGTINQTAWDALPEGSVTITFYVEDLVGLIGNAAVTVTKELSQPGGEIPSYNLFALIGVMIIFTGIISLVLRKKRINSKN